MRITRLSKSFLLISAIALLAILLRLAAIVLLDTLDAPPQYDGLEYDLLARNLLAGAGYTLDGLPTAHRTPVYPAFLALVYALFGHAYAAVRIAQAILGGITAVLGYILARKVYGHRVGLFVALGLALYPHLIYTATVFYSENIFIPLFIGLNILPVEATKRPTLPVLVASGLVLGVGALTRPNLFTFLPLIFLWAWALFPVRQALKYAGVIAVAALLVMGTWAVRNSLAFGTPVGVTTETGVVLWSGNNPFADGGGVMPSPETWGGEEPPDRGPHGWSYLSEPESDRRFRLKAQEWIVQNPQRFATLFFIRIYRFWAPNYLGIRGKLSVPWFVLVGYWLAVAVAVVAVIADYRRWRLQLAFYLFIVYFTLGAGVSFGASRYSFPLIPFLLMWWGVAFWGLWDRLFRKRAHPSSA